VLVERERSPGVDAHHLEDAVTAEQALVGCRYEGVGRCFELAVQDGELRRRAGAPALFGHGA
jgi:hypothetical protein